MQLSNFDIEDFLANYWQKKPLLIRAAISDFKNPVSADELAGLACEDQVESRLISSHNDRWELQHGPFTEQSFSTLAEQDWTLLVQAVDHWDHDVAQLLNYFRFIPNWRIDDVMVSYATAGGSVGPHFDRYDVFLLQGAGKRQWQLGPACDSDSPLLDDQPLSLLADFQPLQHYLLEPGDILYVPPLVSHWGTAADNECMTYSIGFRAPSYSELLADVCDERLSQLTEQHRYTDPSLTLQGNPGEIQAAVIDTVQQQLIAQFSDKNLLTEWFGRYMTQPKYAQSDNPDEHILQANELMELLDQGLQCQRDSSARFAFSRLPDRHILYVNGNSYDCHSSAAQQLAELLAAEDVYPAERLLVLINEAESFNLLLSLLNQGGVYFDSADVD
jgi:50S ribosomal protein L16 3-hydroxylase